jgi:tetratricopeptide (TPR) repeat protein
MHDGTNGPSSACVDEAVLAAYIDGQLPANARAEVEAHLAECDDCYAWSAEVIRTEEETRAHTRPFLTARVAAVGAFVALAASLTLVVLKQPAFIFNRGSSLDAIVRSLGNERRTLARPTGGFSYGLYIVGRRTPTTTPTRAESIGLLAEAVKLKDTADRTKAPADLHAAGVALLIAGQTAESVAALETAEKLSPGNASYLSDIGAARLTLFYETQQRSDADAALAATERALAADPTLQEAAFNKALALAALGRSSEARTAWDAYLALDSGSAWSDEARRWRNTIVTPPASSSPR